MEIKLILEALLFSAQKPLSLKEIRDVLAAAVAHAEGDETVRALKKPRRPNWSLPSKRSLRTTRWPSAATGWLVWRARGNS